MVTDALGMAEARSGGSSAASGLARTMFHALLAAPGGIERPATYLDTEEGNEDKNETETDDGWQERRTVVTRR